jgi:ligand-binding SRPBCC domain-containing protein
MKMDWERKQRKEGASSRGPDTMLDEMAVLNEVAAEHPITEVNYWKAAHTFQDQAKAKIFNGMEPSKRVGWLLRGINIDR